MNPLDGALPVPCVPVWVTHALVAHRLCMHLLTAESQSTAGLLFSSHCLCGMILLTLYFMVGLAGFKTRANAFLSA